MAKHMTHDTGKRQLIAIYESQILTAQEGGCWKPWRDSQRLYLKHSEQSGAVGARPSGFKKVMWLPVSCKKMWLTWFDNSVGWQGTTAHYSGKSRNCAWSPSLKCFLATGPYPWEQSREENLQLSHNFRSFTTQVTKRNL